MKKSEYSDLVASKALEIGAIKLNLKNPFQWASGYRMPIYNDNRLFLFGIYNRNLIIQAFKSLIVDSGEHFSVIAGTSTAGIPWASFLAQELGFHLVYVRDKPKEHGLRNQIEGIDAEKGLEGARTLVIEDLISTGGSSAKAIQAVRDAGGKCDHIFSIFNYGFPEGKSSFSGMKPRCMIYSILDYNALMEVVHEKHSFNHEELVSLQEWCGDPFNWGKLHGFPRVIKEKV